MSTVVPFNGGTRSPEGFLSTHHDVLATPPKLIRVSPDYKRSCVWTRISKHAPAYMSQSLIHDLVSSCITIKGLPTSPFRYRVLLSELPGIFSLGGDLNLFRKCIETQDRVTMTEYAHSAIDAIWESVGGSGYQDLTSIALVQGEAQGGGFEAALSSHILVAERNSHFGFPESLFGMFPGMGAFPLLSARTDDSTARILIGGGRRFSAEELLEMGVVDFVAEPGHGESFVNNIISSNDSCSHADFRARFASIRRNALLDTVDQWVEQALSLSQRNLRSIGYLIQAQKNAIARLN